MDNKILNVKRKTVSWENSLEDVLENEDLVEDLEENEETQNMLVRSLPDPSSF